MQRRQPNDMSRYAYHDAGRIARKMPTNAVAWAYSCTKARCLTNPLAIHRWHLELAA
jgi:hypothetical protein